MSSWRENGSRLLNLAAQAAAETLWPTRCALCDMPSKVLCDRCASRLAFLDWWRACRRCGSPFGYVQCDVCNPIALGRIGRDCLPYAACASAVEFDEDTGRIVRVFKDQGEQRLASVIASFMVRVLPPGWQFEAVTFVPATLSAYRYRGFDHAELIARELSIAIDVPCVSTLSRPRTRDQRKLSARKRIANLSGSFRVQRQTSVPTSVLLVDDVYTTGATLCAASDALIAAGVREVRCLTFARV